VLAYCQGAAAKERDVGDREVMCLKLGCAEGDVCEDLRAAAWDVHVATDLRSAGRLIVKQRFRVGLLLAHDIDEEDISELDAFLKLHGTLEWVGAFPLSALALPACHDLILDHCFDHHTLPVQPHHLAQTMGHAFGRALLRDALDGPGQSSEGPIVGKSDAIKDLKSQIRRIAKVNAPVLIRGESGSGKELAAQAIHRQSARANGPFIAVNCGAIQASLIQSELFGHVKGAFTGAASDERGLIEAANGGTIFLDEIGDIPLDLQTNLLRFLQEMTINRVGSARSIHVDVRVIAATNVDLDAAVAAGKFREDLFYRLNVLPLHAPPLRERRSDISLLAHYCYKQYLHDKSPHLKGFSRSALMAMEAHDWPGNVRELINRVRRAMVMSEGRLITPFDLGLQGHSGIIIREALDEARTEAERSAISVSLQSSGKNVTQAARQLGVSRMTLYRLMAKYSIAN
jgi:two-component system response regulator HydG